MQTDYEELHKISRQAQLLEGVSQILDWDRETYMPPAGAEIRADQMEILAGLIHEKRTSKKFSTALSKLIDLETGTLLSHNLSDSQIAAVKEWRREYLVDTSLPKDFVEEFAKLTSHSMNVWQSAREKNDFSLFLPQLTRIIEMSRKKADYLKYEQHPYDALLGLYEHQMTSQEVSKIFTPLRTSLTELLKKITQKPFVDDAFLHGNFSADQQIAFGKVILNAMGYDMQRGRLDLSTHPFSSGSHPSDNRITTRIHPTSLMSSITAVLHEAGHGLYEMGLPPEHYGSALGSFISLGIHESQSRWWETRIGLSKPFWEHFLPILKNHFKGQLDNISLDQFYRALNKVSPSYIRVEADEVTYGLHVILRFEIEYALIEGSLSPKDVPEVWNAKMKDLLGIVPPNNTLGCLQDIHWAMGGFGYFPTYTLGNLYASQFFTAFESEFPQWKNEVSQGKLLFIKDWLGKNVHQYGKRYSSKELIQKVTGQPFSAQPYIDYLNNKYTDM